MRMLYEVRDEAGRPGVACVVVPAAAGRARGIVEFIVVGDDVERPYLGLQGWQPVEYRWRSDKVRDEGVDMLVPIGERVTCQIEDYATLTIRFPALGCEGVVSWQGITPPVGGAPAAASRDPGGGSSFFNEPVVEPAVKAAPEPEPEPEPPPPLPPPPPPPPPDDRRGLGWMLAVLALLLIVGAGAGYAYYAKLGPFAVAAPPPAQETPPSPPPAPAEPPPPAQPAQQQPAPAQPTTPQPTPLTPEQKQTQIQTWVTEGRYDEATRLLNELENANFGPAQLYRARMLDSIDFVGGLYAQPNDRAALELYAKACRNGQTAAARDDLQRLAQALRKMADEGDAFAEQNLRTALPKAMSDCN